jgi:hypothetical protein
MFKCGDQNRAVAVVAKGIGLRVEQDRPKHSPRPIRNSTSGNADSAISKDRDPSSHDAQTLASGVLRPLPTVLMLWATQRRLCPAILCTWCQDSLFPNMEPSGGLASALGACADSMRAVARIISLRPIRAQLERLPENQSWSECHRRRASSSMHRSDKAKSCPS